MVLVIEQASKEGCWHAPTRDVERWKQYGPDSNDQFGEREESLIKIPKKRKDARKPSKDEVATS